MHSDVETNKVTAMYNKKGNWIYTINSFDKSALDKNVMGVVNDNFHNYFIKGMKRIDQPGNQSVFVVYIQNHQLFKTVRVSNGQIEVVQNFQQAGSDI